MSQPLNTPARKKVALGTGLFLFISALTAMITSIISRDTIVVESSLGEKLVSQKSSVEISEFNTDMDDEIRSTRERLAEEKDQLSRSIRERNETCKNKTDQDGLDGAMNNLFCSYDNLDVSRNELSVSEYQRRLDAMLHLNGKPSKVKIVRYRLIAIDVNGDKSAGNWQTIHCFSKGLGKDSLQKWIYATGETPPSSDGSLGKIMEVRLCERYGDSG